MYGFNVYENYTKGEFRRLTSYYCNANNREEATVKALKWAQENYPTRNVDVVSTN